MKKINVKFEDITYVLNDEWEFECAHDHVSVEPYCCNGNNCSCGGGEVIYCDDCDKVFDPTFDGINFENDFGGLI